MQFGPGDYADFLRRDSAAFANAARNNLTTRVPSCPDWTVDDLTEHLTNAHHFWRLIAERRVQDPHELDDVEPPSPEDRVSYFLDHAASFADLLENEDPATRVWTWSAKKNVGFIQCRMAHETAVHRYDAQLAVNDPQPIDGDFATDGIDEFFEHFFEARQPAVGSGELIHMHRTDGDGEWLVRLTPTGADVSRGHAKGDVAVRGNASDLLLLLWRRVAADGLERFGDRSLLDRILANADLD